MTKEHKSALKTGQLAKEVKILLENYLLLVICRNSLKDEDYDGLPRNQNFMDRILMLNKRYLDDREIEEKLQSIKAGNGFFDQFSVTKGSLSTEDRPVAQGYRFGAPKQAEIIEVEGKGDSPPSKVLFTYLFPDDEPSKGRNESNHSQSQSRRKYSIHHSDPKLGNVFSVSKPRLGAVDGAKFFKSGSNSSIIRPEVRISRSPKPNPAASKDSIFQLFAYFPDDIEILIYFSQNHQPRLLEQKQA